MFAATFPLCRPFQNEKDPVENLDRVVYRKGDADIIDSWMQVATGLGERVRMWPFIQVKSQVLWRSSIGVRCQGLQVIGR